MTTKDDTVRDGACFAPKTFGYGAGLPIAWQGWTLLAGYGVVVTALALLLAEDHQALFVALTLIATAALLLVTARRTRGGWHWRWGGKDA